MERYNAQIGVCMCDSDEVYMEFMLKDLGRDGFLSYQGPYINLTPKNIFDYE